MTPPLPEAWLRGPVAGIPVALQPVAHALVASLEDVTAAVDGLTAGQLWLKPGGAASIGFHLMHLSGSTDRLFTYARGEALSDTQRTALVAERALAGLQPDSRPAATALLANWGRVVEGALQQLSQTPAADLDAARAVGRDQLPSSVRGLLCHAGEHAQRHTGQVITTAKILRGASAGESPESSASSGQAWWRGSTAS